MKISWAPWRMEFIAGKRERGCVFCNRVRRKKDRGDYILHRGRWNFVILNKYPYNSGHLMVVPNRHVAEIERLSENEGRELFALLQRAGRILKKTFGAEGLNMGLNLGRAAGAGIKDHLHFHVIPRWVADTNFWPVIAETKGMPEHLLATYDRLKKAWK